MSRPQWLDTRVSLGNIITWLTLMGGIFYMVAEVQADIKALKEFKDKTETAIEKANMQRALDREAVIEIKADIKIIRQMLEQSSSRRSDGNVR